MGVWVSLALRSVIMPKRGLLIGHLPTASPRQLPVLRSANVRTDQRELALTVEHGVQQAL